MREQGLGGKRGIAGGLATRLRAPHVFRNPINEHTNDTGIPSSPCLRKCSEVMLVSGDFAGLSDIQLSVIKTDVESTLQTLIRAHAENLQRTREMFKDLWRSFKTMDPKVLEFRETLERSLLVFYVLLQILFGNPVPYTVREMDSMDWNRPYR